MILPSFSLLLVTRSSLTGNRVVGLELKQPIYRGLDKWFPVELTVPGICPKDDGDLGFEQEFMNPSYKPVVVTLERNFWLDMVQVWTGLRAAYRLFLDWCIVNSDLSFTGMICRVDNILDKFVCCSMAGNWAYGADLA
ncbi:unnamed protein product [Vicia faba]|uniref:Uncharacterized protein n=1 Tax=Vicia faba TaxID=3906 RepID=A0AAV0YVB3_VICFA|nr:unnamed protein product [Vicia faba]